MTTRKPITLPRLLQMHTAGEKIAMLTAYDATFARAVDEAGVECILVGDSLGMVLQGHATTVPVTLADMAYHVASAARGNRTSWLIGDLPYGSYHTGTEEAYRSAATLMQAGAHMVKLEGGGWTAAMVAFLTQRGIPVCAHLGLTPQTVHALGGYRVQGRDEGAAAKLKADAKALQDAGATLLVLEMTPTALATELTRALKIPTIGIGAGPGTSGQVLVLHDMLGLGLGKTPRFVKNFMDGQPSIAAALAAFVAAVKSGAFPDPAVHGFE